MRRLKLESFFLVKLLDIAEKWIFEVVSIIPIMLLFSFCYVMINYSDRFHLLITIIKWIMWVIREHFYHWNSKLRSLFQENVKFFPLFRLKKKKKFLKRSWHFQISALNSPIFSSPIWSPQLSSRKNILFF